MRHLKFILLLLFVQACGSSVPLSEVYIFNHQPGSSPHDSLSFTRAGGLSFFPSDLSDVFYRSKFDHYVETEKEGTPLSGLNELPVGFNYSHAANFREFAVGYNIGIRTLGLNTTFRVVGRNYVSINMSVFNGVESILQRPVMQNQFTFLDEGLHEFNASIGFYSKAENVRYRTFIHSGYGIDGDSTIDHSDFIYHWGLRSFFQLRNLSDNRMFVGFVSTGYAPELDDVIINFGLTVGFIRF